MNKKVTPLIEYVSESTMACVITMAQGNILALTVGHLMVAFETGIIAGGITAVSVFLARTNMRWMISVILGITTGLVDFFVHPGSFGAIATEAIVTGIGAAVISYLVGAFWPKVKTVMVRTH